MTKKKIVIVIATSAINLKKISSTGCLVYHFKIINESILLMFQHSIM